VVNEAIDDAADVYYRPTPFYTIIGEEYITKAFQWAHEADPDAILFYNDYNTENPVKREKILKLVKQLKDAGVPIHAIGLQGHWSIFDPTPEAVDESIKKFAALGFKVQITELDISVYKSEQGRREKKTDEADKFTPEMEQKQRELYDAHFKVLRKYKSIVSGVTFWNVSDRRSWLDNFPVRGRKNYPLLFDQGLKPKPAYYKVIDFQAGPGTL
jgi:endo-1,4-beta-xylanase